MRNITHGQAACRKENPIAKTLPASRPLATQLYESNTKESSQLLSSRHMYSLPQDSVSEDLLLGGTSYSLGFVSGSCRMPSASSRRRASSRAHVWMLRVISQIDSAKNSDAIYLVSGLKA